MTLASSLSSPAMSQRRYDALIAISFSALYFLQHWFGGFSTLHDSLGDNDSVMRLVQVRDLLNGQGWFDLHQYRMGLGDGLRMHWSRLVDLPIAILIATMSAVTGDAAAGEMAARVLWPLILFSTALYLCIRIAREAGGPYAVLPAAMTSALALYFINIFRPGSLDHHNLQVVLALATIHFLVRANTSVLASAGAGSTAALMLAIAMEGAPYVAVAAGFVSLLFLIRGAEQAKRAGNFGLAFAGTAAVCLAATLPVGSWLAPQCDMFSLPQASLALLGGIGLATIASAKILRATLVSRLASLAILAAGLSVVVIALFPQCLSDPYGAIDPLLRQRWLDDISEMRSVWAVLNKTPADFPAYYATPLLAACVIGWRLARRRLSHAELTVALFLAASLLVSLWQLRGAMFSITIAAVALSIWVGEFRRKSDEAGNPAGLQLAAVGAWIASITLVWRFATMGLVAASATAAGTASAEPPEASQTCTAYSDYARLAELSSGRVLATSNLGPAILSETSHQVLAGSYHRNIAGNQAAIDMLLAEPDKAHAMALDRAVTYVASCPGNGEDQFMANQAPNGLAGLLMAGKPPAWLTPIESSAGLRLYRVAQR